MQARQKGEGVMNWGTPEALLPLHSLSLDGPTLPE